MPLRVILLLVVHYSMLILTYFFLLIKLIFFIFSGVESLESNSAEHLLGCMAAKIIEEEFVLFWKVLQRKNE